ncbi:MAG: hypothetical protein H6622_17525 [Halobacteriovoraceae bacterium]|nr:hypothetical protein [Halobacteriovoraceae bacterium]
MTEYINLLQDNLLAIVLIIFTIVLIRHYVIEKDKGTQLSKKYRNSIFEAQSKIFLNASQYLISGNKDLAIKEFLNAVDINRETLETYFALGGLFRSNGEIDKAISIHRSLIARENISETTRLRSLKELAIDFDKGGFLDKAISTYRDVLKINRDQPDVIKSLCRIYEDIGDWDEAYNYRQMLSKVSHDSQSETISHILVEKAKELFNEGHFRKCDEELEEAFRFAPSVTAKILKLKLFLVSGKIEDAQNYLVEIINEFPMYTSFVFVSLEEPFKADEKISTDYKSRLELLRDFFLKLGDSEVTKSTSVALSKVRLLKNFNRTEEAFAILDSWIKEIGPTEDAIVAEYIKLLIEMGKKEQALEQTQKLLKGLSNSLARHFCSQCGYESDNIFWRCPQCHTWETIQFRWKI